MLAILIIPVLTAIICYNVRNPRVVGYVSLAGVVALAWYAFSFIAAALTAPVSDLSGAFSMDALSGYIMALVIFLSLASAIYSISYLEHEYETGLMNLRGVRTYYGLFHLFVFTMLLVCMANNLAVMWIGIEATTIVSALLIGLGFHKRPLAVEAAWKYIILCTVGITFALLGTFITYYASTSVMGAEGALNWTGGTLVERLVGCTGLFTGGMTWRPSVVIPGYLFRHDGKMDAQCPTPTNGTTWGRIKSLYR